MENYIIEKEIGTGGYGEVYKGRIKKNDEEVAIKLIPVSFSKEKLVNIALQEVNILKNFNCEYIVTFYDVFCCNYNGVNSIMMVMSFYNKGDLNNFIKNIHSLGSEVEEYQYRKWLKDLMIALEYVHSKNIIHRDVKSSNIFVKDNLDLALGDFGISRKINEDENYIFTKAGTALYMSPEIYLGKGYDFSTDIWSSGVTFYDLITDHLPFNAEGEIPLYFVGKYKIPEIKSTKYSKEFCSLVMKMLEPNAKKRITAREIINYKYVTNVDCSKNPIHIRKPSGLQLFNMNKNRRKKCNNTDLPDREKVVIDICIFLVVLCFILIIVSIFLAI